MDDAADRGYSRAPELEDLLSLIRALDRAGARYLLIGGFAVILHGFVRTTKDIDLLVDPSPESHDDVVVAHAPHLCRREGRYRAGAAFVPAWPAHPT